MCKATFYIEAFITAKFYVSSKNGLATIYF